MVAGAFSFWEGAKTIRLGYLSRNWPITEAKVISSKVVSERRRTTERSTSRQELHYHAEVQYQFSVAGKSYTSNNIEFRQRRNGQRGSLDPSYARSTIERFPLGAITPVSYSPANPAQCVLRPGVHANKGVILYPAGGIFFVVGVAVLRRSMANAKKRKSLNYPSVEQPDVYASPEHRA